MKRLESETAVKDVVGAFGCLILLIVIIVLAPCWLPLSIVFLIVLFLRKPGPIAKENKEE